MGVERAERLKIYLLRVLLSGKGIKIMDNQELSVLDYYLTENYRFQLKDICTQSHSVNNIIEWIYSSKKRNDALISNAFDFQV